MGYQKLAQIYRTLERPQVAPEAALEKILIDFYERMAKDLLLNHFFQDQDLRSIAKIQKQFLMRAMGATPGYSGRPPATAHSDIPSILSGHFDRRLVILEQTLREHGVAPEHVTAWIAFEEAFRSAIVVQEGVPNRAD